MGAPSLETASVPVSGTAVTVDPGAGRLVSLDFARGLTLIFMVVVNNPGTWDHVFPPLKHAAWNGFTPTDFVFPNFLFIVGASLALALSRKRAAGASLSALLLPLLRRCALLFLIGVSITAVVIDFDFAHLRIPGVLQRIALVSAICGVLYLTLGRRTLYVTSFGLLFAYYALLHWVPVPGHGAANLGAETNLGAWLDSAVFGPDHLYRFTRTWDPEGLLSTLPAVSTGLFGLLAGLLLLGSGSPRSKLKALLIAGGVLTVLGLAAHPSFPINKSLWTSSYALFAGGLSCLFLAGCFYMFDMRGGREAQGLQGAEGARSRFGFTPWVLAFGMNSIFAYVFSELFPTLLEKIPGTGGRHLLKTIYEGAFASWVAPPALASLAWALCMLATVSVPVWILYRKKILIKL
jgi:predicted acyltransferase